MKEYEIVLSGCDADTSIKIELSKKEKEFIDKLCELSIKNSRYGCMPIMSIHLKKRL